MVKKEAKSTIDDVLSRLILAPISNTHIDTAMHIAERVLGEKGIDLKYKFMDPRKFTVGEYCPKFVLGGDKPKNYRGRTVYLIAHPSPYLEPEEIIERIHIAAFSAREHYADKVVLLATDFPHARQDRGHEEDEKALGEPTTVRCHARTFKAVGIDEVITTHQHSPRIPAFFALEYGLIPKEMLAEEARELAIKDIIVPKHVSMDNPEIQKIGKTVFKSLSPSSILADYLLHHSSLVGSPYLKNDGERFVLKALDKGNRPFIDELYHALFLRNVSIMRCGKLRYEKNNPKALKVEVEEVSDNFTTLVGKAELFADDGGDTMGTQERAAEWSDNGNVCTKTGKMYGVPDIRLIHLTHAWLAGKSFRAIQEKILKSIRCQEITMANTRPYIDNEQDHRFKEKSSVFRCSGLWGDATLANELGHNLEQRYTRFSCEEEQHQFVEPLYRIKRHSEHFLVDGKASEKREVVFRLRE